MAKKVGHIDVEATGLSGKSASSYSKRARHPCIRTRDYGSSSVAHFHDGWSTESQ